MLLIFDIPTLNNEAISFESVIVPIEKNYVFVSKIISSSSLINLSIKSQQTSIWGFMVLVPNFLLTDVVLIVPLR